MRFRVFTVLLPTCSLAEAQRRFSENGSPQRHCDRHTWLMFKPEEPPAPALSRLHVREGFRLQKSAKNAADARNLAIGPTRNLYVTGREGGAIPMFSADGFRCATPAEAGPALTAAMRWSQAAPVEAVVDPAEPPAKPEHVRASAKIREPRIL